MASVFNALHGGRYEAVSRGEMFQACSVPTVSGVVGATSFASATPLLGLGHTTGNKNILVDTLTLSQNGTAAGGVISYLGFVSTSDRIAGTGASGGTAITVYDMNLAKNGTSDVSFYEKRTIDGTTGDLIPVFARTAPNTLGTTTVIGKDEGILIPKTGCLLVYAFAGTTAPTLRWDMNWREY